MTDAQTEARAIQRYIAPSAGRGAVVQMLKHCDGEWVRYRDHATALAAKDAELVAVKAERDEARSIVRDIHWMAVRYADNRRSYAVGMCNDAIQKAYDAGWLVYNNDRDPQYARDGMFDAEWCSAVDAANDRAERAEARLAEARKALNAGEALSRQLHAVIDRLNGQAYSSTLSALNYFDAARRALEAQGGENNG